MYININILWNFFIKFCLGNTVLDEVMMSLLHAYEMFEEQRRNEVREEEAREMRETMKAEQDAAYHASLQADRAKVSLFTLNSWYNDTIWTQHKKL